MISSSPTDIDSNADLIHEPHNYHNRESNERVYNSLSHDSESEHQGSNQLPIVVTMDSIPTEPITAKDEAKLLADELNAMSVQEREKVYEEIHGVDSDTPESPELISSYLRKFDVQLSHIKNKPAYDLAYQLNAGFVANDKFRLMFLRSTQFQVNAAAEKLVSYFEYKLDLFGPNKLDKRITLADLSADDAKSLRTGAIQILPRRDKSGRAVVFDCQTSWQFRVADNQVNKIQQSVGALVMILFS